MPWFGGGSGSEGRFRVWDEVEDGPATASSGGSGGGDDYDEGRSCCTPLQGIRMKKSNKTTTASGGSASRRLRGIPPYHKNNNNNNNNNAHNRNRHHGDDDDDDEGSFETLETEKLMTNGQHSSHQYPADDGTATTASATPTASAATVSATQQNREREIQDVLVQDFGYGGGSSSDATTIQRGLSRLADLAYSGGHRNMARQYVQAICDTGAHRVAVKVMTSTRYSHNADLQLEGCRLFANVSFFGAAGVVPVISIGGVQVLLKAIQVFSQNAKIQRTCFLALINIVVHAKAVTSIIIQRGGVPRILHAMDHFPHERALQWSACHLLRHMAAARDSARRELVRAGAATALAAVYERHCTASSSSQAAATAMAARMAMKQLLQLNHADLDQK